SARARLPRGFPWHAPRYGASGLCGCTLKAFVCFESRPARGLLSPLRKRRKAVAPEDLKPHRDGAECAYQEECPTHGPALIRGETVRQQQPKAGAQRRTGAGDQDEFRKSDSRFSHRSISRWYGW